MREKYTITNKVLIHHFSYTDDAFLCLAQSLVLRSLFRPALLTTRAET